MVASHPVEKSKLVQVLVAPYRVVSIDARCRAVVLLTEQSARITLLVRQPTQQLAHGGSLHAGEGVSGSDIIDGDVVLH